MNAAVNSAAATLAPVIAQAVRESSGLDNGNVDQITKDVAAVVVNQTNQEPWYQSTVTIGALVTLVGGGYNLVWEIAVNGPPAPAAFTALATPLIGAAVTLYGRWWQRKAIGE